MSKRKSEIVPLYLNPDDEAQNLVLKLRNDAKGNKAEFLRALAKGGAYLHEWGVLDLVLMLKERGVDDPVKAFETILMLVKSDEEKNTNKKSVSKKEPEVIVDRASLSNVESEERTILVGAEEVYTA